MATNYCDFAKNKKIVLLLVAAAMIGSFYIVTTNYAPSTNGISQMHRANRTMPKHLLQRNALSRELNLMKQLYGQLSCQQLKAKGQQVNTLVSENGGWCAEISGPDSVTHRFDQPFAKALSSFLKGKTVGSFGDGPGQYKKHLDSLREVALYDAFDGAPYCDTTTQGQVKFLDLTAPQYGLRSYDWVVSVEVGEHIPAKYEDVYLDNLVRHAREGIILSWGVPGQDGLSHVNLKPLKDVIAQMNRRGFDIDNGSGQILRNSSTFGWLRANIQVYRRINSQSFIEDDV